MILVRSCFIAFSLLTVVAAADAQVAGSVSVAQSQFTAKVEGGRPTGDPDLSHARSLTYWLEVKNTGTPSHVTLVWQVDGREVLRQSLDVGTAPAWKTWGSAPVSGGKTVEVEVLDDAGASLKRDKVSAS